jgi:hypothetical protein
MLDAPASNKQSLQIRLIRLLFGTGFAGAGGKTKHTKK